MASTTEHQARRAQRDPARGSASERAAAAKSADRRGLIELSAAIAVALAAIVVVAVAISSGARSGTAIPRQPAARRLIDASIARLLGGIPEHGAALGDPRAPVTLTFYGDLQCSICRDFTLYGGLTQLIEDQVRAGRVRILYSPFETATRSARTFYLQQAAALAAGRQHRLWYYVETFYREQGRPGSGYVTGAYLDGLARQVPGLDYARWLAQRRERSLLAQVAAAQRAARSAGVQGTPTLIFRGAGGRSAQPPETIPDYDQLMQALREVL